MKDIGHHLKHIQKKVLQSVRKESHQSKNTLDSDSMALSEEKKVTKEEKREASPPRLPRLIAKSTVH